MKLTGFFGPTNQTIYTYNYNTKYVNKLTLFDIHQHTIKFKRNMNNLIPNQYGTHTNSCSFQAKIQLSVPKINN